MAARVKFPGILGAAAKLLGVSALGKALLAEVLGLEMRRYTVYFR